MSNEKQLVKRSAMERMANRLHVSRDVLEATLKATVCKGTKMQNGQYKPVTNEEFVAFIAVANNYKLNPLIKEIYAYPDTKSAGIIPIVSTDGWNKLMTTHPKYKTHFYKQAEEMVKPTEVAKNCPEWIEIHIVKTDDSIVAVREYLDECYNGGKKYKDGKPISSPWDTHTKRMLRHKTKIQGAREAFGFGGIYDQDEGERIIEAHLVEDPKLTGKPEVNQPTSISAGPEQSSKTEEKPEPEKKAKKKSGAPEIKSEKDMAKKKPDSAFAEMIKDFKNIKEVVGDKVYYEKLGSNGCEHANQIKTIKEGAEIMQEMLQAKKDNAEEREPGQEG